MFNIRSHEEDTRHPVRKEVDHLAENLRYSAANIRDHAKARKTNLNWGLTALAVGFLLGRLF